MTGASVPRGWGGSGFVTVIPARDEAARLPRALASLAAAGGRDAVVVANGCRDATAAVARAHPGPLRVVVIETPALPGGVGEARALGMALAVRRAPGAIFATTDADCEVDRRWIDAVREAMARADTVCGRIVPDPAEFARLPRIVRVHGNLEDLASDLEAELDGLRDPRAHDPLPRHAQTPGASLAFTAAAYLRAGGFDPVPCHEDRRLVARMEALGLRVARPAAVRVSASCRTRGRAPGGMACTIAARRDGPERLAAEIDELRARVARLRAEIASAREFHHQGGHPYVPPFQQAAI